MSQFIDKLKRLSQGAPESIGFRHRQALPPKPKMQLVASLAPGKLNHLADFVAGADAVLVPITQGNAAVPRWAKMAQAVADIPWGCWLRGE